jgi:hypothetical protein
MGVLIKVSGHVRKEKNSSNEGDTSDLIVRSKEIYISDQVELLSKENCAIKAIFVNWN